MSQSTFENERTFEAAADLSDKQYYCVELTAENKVNAASTLGEITVGVLQNKPEAGEAARVRFGGTSKVVASTAIAVGALVTAAAGGKAVSTTTAGHYVWGQALEAASADGDNIEIGPLSRTRI